MYPILLEKPVTLDAAEDPGWRTSSRIWLAKKLLHKNSLYLSLFSLLDICRSGGGQ